MPTIPRLLIAGTGSGCGKTTTVCAILQALKNRGLNPAAFKCGPDYIDPMFHEAVLGIPCRNLDLHFFCEDTLRTLLARGGQGHGISVMEGVMGFYDGIGMTSAGSSFAVAKAAAAPTVLVVNAKGASRSILATITGFLALEADSGIRGVILNHCSPMLYGMLKAEILHQFGGAVKPLGYLPPMPECSIESRHLGLLTAAEVSDLAGKLQRLATQAEKSLDLDGILALSAEAPDLAVGETAAEKGAPVRIGIARDEAFCFYYADALDILTEMGAQLIPFSPIHDAALPEGIQGLYLGGGYPEVHKAALAANASMRCAVRNALERGLPCIAECGGFLYLQESLEDAPMVGFLPGKGFNTGKLSRFGYVTLTAQGESMLFAPGDRLPAHEFHYYDVEDPGSALTAAKHSGKSWPCGIVSPTLYAGFPHFHFTSNPVYAQRFLDCCRKVTL